MMNGVIEALRSSSKGQLRYDNHWTPTAESLNECTSPPLVVARFGKLGLHDESDNYDLPFSQNLRADPGFSPSLPKKSQTNEVPRIENSPSLSGSSSSADVVNFIDMDIFVAVLHYDKNKRQEVIAKSQSRRGAFEKHSQNLLKEKKDRLRELQEIKEQRFLMEVEAIQKNERERTDESKKRQEKLYKDHQEHAARAVRNFKLAELKRKQIEEAIKNKQEIEKLQILVQELQNEGLGVRKNVKEFKHQKHLPAATEDLLHEIDKILKMSAEAIKNAKGSGRPLEQDKELISRFASIMSNMVSKSKHFISEALKKAEKERAELEAKVEAEKAQRANEAKKAAAKQTAAIKSCKQDHPSQSTTITTTPKQKPTLPTHLLDCVSEASFKEYSQLVKILEDTRKDADVLVSDKSKPMKQYRFDLQKAVTTPVNAISDQSPSHLLDKIQRLTKLLSGKPVQVTGKEVSANSHPAGQVYCRDLLAKKLVMQGFHQVSTSHNSAFPIASVAIAISSAFPDIRRLILGHFYKQCPFLVPFYIPKTEGTSEEDYYKSLGYECSGGTVEPQDKFLKRMTGLVRLFAAIISSLPPPGINNNPFGLELGWAFLARILNLRPRQDYTATALYEFLDVAGHALQRQYGKQFWKLLHVLIRDYLPKINEVTDPAQSGPVVRLKGFLEGCIKNRTLKIPDGYLTSRWWKSPSSGFGF